MDYEIYDAVNDISIDSVCQYQTKGLRFVANLGYDTHLRLHRSERRVVIPFTVFCLFGLEDNP
jgi:hypothetical protein